jgi:uncharacterized protein (DUF362 family)
MRSKSITRRELLWSGGAAVLGMAASRALGVPQVPAPASAAKSPVSVVRIKNDNVAAAVEEALDLLGGVAEIAKGKQRVMLKPNLLAEDPGCTTKPAVVRTLARLMKSAGKEVSIGEGSAAGVGFNLLGGEVFWTRKTSLIDAMQQHVFEMLGYTQLARDLGIPLINLHSGDMVSVPVPGGGLCYDTLSLHHSLADTDLLCSVPMMKTHALAGVTLGLKNLVGLYPGTVYGTVRSQVHDHAADRGSPGVAFEILDMVRANKLGLVVVDGSTAMEGDGPSQGVKVPMNVIVAGTNALATDLVAARLMGFEPHEVPTFACARRIGMSPSSLDEIEVRGAPIADVARPFARPRLYTWNEIRSVWGARQL